MQKLQKRGSLLDVLPPDLRNECVVVEAIQAINIALLCVQQDPRRRPSMSEVVTMFLGNKDVKSISEEDTRDGLSHAFLLLTRNGENLFSSLESVVEEDSPLFPSTVVV